MTCIYIIRIIPDTIRDNQNQNRTRKLPKCSFAMVAVYFTYIYLRSMAYIGVKFMKGLRKQF